MVTGREVGESAQRSRSQSRFHNRRNIFGKSDKQTRLEFQNLVEIHDRPGCGRRNGTVGKTPWHFHFAFEDGTLMYIHQRYYMYLQFLNRQSRNS